VRWASALDADDLNKWIKKFEKTGVPKFLNYTHYIFFWSVGVGVGHGVRVGQYTKGYVHDWLRSLAVTVFDESI
jgi:hypothetical protein